MGRKEVRDGKWEHDWLFLREIGNRYRLEKGKVTREMEEGEFANPFGEEAQEEEAGFQAGVF